MKKSKHSTAYVRRTIDAAWWTFTRAAQRFSEYTEAYEAEVKAEKEHRAFGARFTKGAASYRLPVHYAAKLFVLQHTWEGLNPKVKPPTSWIEFNGFSRRVAVCYALAEKLLNDGRDLEAFGIGDMPFGTPPIMAIDYAEDIAA